MSSRAPPLGFEGMKTTALPPPPTPEQERNRVIKYVRSSCHSRHYAICEACAERPIPEHSTLCFACAPNPDINGRCYQCSRCVETRRYLEETDRVFTLKGYGSSYETELWWCARCEYFIELGRRGPSLLRDCLHEIARKEHARYVCDYLKGGQYDWLKGEAAKEGAP